MSGLRDILERFSRGEIDLEDALSRIRLLSYREVGSIAKIDHMREDRIDVPEAILAEEKGQMILQELRWSISNPQARS